MLSHYVDPSAVVGDPRDDVTDYIRTKQFNANTMLALRDTDQRHRQRNGHLQGTEERPPT